MNLNQSLSTVKNGFQGIWKFSVKGMGDQRIWNQALWSRLWYRFFSKVFLTIPRRFQIIKKEFLNLNQSLSTVKNGFQGIWKFSVKGNGGPKDLKSGPVVPPLVSIFFKTGSNYPQTFSNNQEGVSELKPITFQLSKTDFKAFENFRSKVRGGPKDLKSGPVVPPLVSIFFKTGSNYPQTFSNNQEGVSELKPITFNCQKRISRHLKIFGQR